MKHALLGALAFATACATPYQGGMLGKGADAEWLSDDMLVVTARGNAYTSEQKIVDYVALKAAEKAIAAGFRYMVIAKSVNISQSATHYVHAHSPSDKNACDAHPLSPEVETSDHAIVVQEPGRRTTYQLYNEPPEGFAPDQYEDAYASYNTLGPKHLKTFTPIAY